MHSRHPQVNIRNDIPTPTHLERQNLIPPFPAALGRPENGTNINLHLKPWRELPARAAITAVSEAGGPLTSHLPSHSKHPCHPKDHWLPTCPLPTMACPQAEASSAEGKARLNERQAHPELSWDCAGNWAQLQGTSYSLGMAPPGVVQSIGHMPTRGSHG